MPLTTGQLDLALLNSELYQDQLLKLSIRLRTEPRLWNNDPVIDELSLGAILTQPDKTISTIINQISNNEFEFNTPKVIQLSTGDKVRKVTIYPWPERIVLMVLQKALTQNLESVFSKSLYSFIKGRSTYHAKNKFRKFLKKYPNAIIAKRDISGYGDNISSRKLYQMLTTLIDLENNPKTDKIIKHALGDLPVGIPTGSPLTPFFENVYLMSLDHFFKTTDQAEQHFYARYGDDFIFSSQDENWFQHSETESSRIIQELGLNVADHKKTTMKFKTNIESIDWLGSAFKKRGLVTSKKKHSQLVYRDFKFYFSKLISRLAKSSNIDLAIPVIQKALIQYLSHRQNGQLGKVIIHRNDAQITKMLDANIKFLLVKYISNSFKLNKSRAWKVVRKMNIPSLNYQRRLLYRLNKYE
jgi:hypothetical protein